MFNFLIFVLGAALMFGMGLRSVLARRKLCQKGEKVTARVAGTVQGRDGQAYVLEFETAGGSHRLHYPKAAKGNGFDTGADVTLYYDPENLEKMYVEGDRAVLGAEVLYFVLAVVLLVAANNGKKRAQQAAAALGELLRSYGAQDADGIYYQAEVHRAAYRACAAAMQAEQKAAAALEDAREHQCETHERLLQSLDFESGTGEAAALYQRRSALESVCTRLRTQQAQLTGAALAIGDPMALKSEHAQLLEQRDALERQYAAIALAIETLGRADAELQSRFSPQLAQKAADYMDYLTDGRYDELVLARDLSAKARSTDDPTPRDTAYLSAGTADLLYLSVRLALCELTCPADDPCPLVLDDTLVNFDDARAGRAMALFREIAQHRQVILFTCHERDCPAQA